MPPEEHVASNLCGQHLGVEVAAEYLEASTVWQRPLLPLLRSHPEWTASIQDHNLGGHTVALSEEGLALVR